MKTFFTLLISSFLLFTSLSLSAKDLKDEIRAVLKNNPSIIVDVINENPILILEALQKASIKANAALKANRAKSEKNKMESAFANPLKPTIRKDEAIRGTRNAPIVIVEYSDFQCPYCTRGNKTVQALLKKYKGKIQFIYKHMPLSFHSEAKMIARYYEAIRMQSNKLAFKFHDLAFEHSKSLAQGEKFIKTLAKRSGANMKKLARTLKNKNAFINNRIKDDMNEAAKFGFQGTPAFIVNGIPLEGAVPIEYFENVIKELVKRKIVKL